ncbi:MAG: nucleoside deaminase [Paludibacteraceae bacterium]|nr:nucleoside deaminase [Paludibacteraceae bacterium]
MKTQNNKNEEQFMRLAIELSIKSVNEGGGPFGAVIVKDGEIIAASANRVTINNDPTAHAEVMAIREACQKLGTFDLSGCELYASCEPCPMCLSAMYWAHIEKYYYANDQHDAAKIGFDDHFIYEELDKPVENRTLKRVQILHEEAMEAFKQWEDKSDKTEY